LHNHGTLHGKYWARADADSTSTHNTGTTAHATACANTHTAANIRAHNSSADNGCTDSSTAAATSTGPVLHWSRWRVQCPLLFGRVVRRERIQLRGLRWQLVRRLFTDASSTNTCREPNSYTSGSDASSSRPRSVLLRSRVHRQLRCRWMVRWERGQLCWLRRRLVQFSSGARAQLHDEASEGPRGMNELQ